MANVISPCDKEILIENRHKFAAWTASAAARRGISRFSGLNGLKIIEDSGLSKISRGWDILRPENEFDKWHKLQRSEVIKIARKLDISLTDGLAAKLINVYLKSLFLASNQEQLSDDKIEKMNAIHPPVDRELLKCLAKNLVDNPHISKEELDGFRRYWKNVNWTQLDSDGYQKVIDSFKKVVGNKGLWTIEKYWPGYQLR